MLPKSPRAIFIDLDGTVYSYSPCHDAGLQSAWKAAQVLHKNWKEHSAFMGDYDQARREVKKYTEGQAAEHCRLLYFKKMVESKKGNSHFAWVEILHDSYWRGYFSALQLDEDCRETLERFKESGATLVWITNFTTERQFQKIRHLKLESTVPHLVTSEEVGMEKPGLVPFQEALRRFHLSAKEVVMIGDDWKADILPALSLGMGAVWFNRDSKVVATDARAITVSRWAELREIFNEKTSLVAA